MAKRTREDLGNNGLPELTAPKYRRVAPKQEMDIPSFTDTPNNTNNQSTEGFGLHPNQPQQNPPYGVNFRPTLPAPTPSFPIQAQPQQTPPPTTPPPPQQGQVKFETALEFLDQVKLQFGATPQVYKQFLKIMKDFKLHEIDTPGVIQRVSELFHGHEHLILGFNRFLPEGYKITLSDIRKNAAAMPNISQETNTNSAQFHTHPLPASPTDRNTLNSQGSPTVEIASGVVQQSKSPNPTVSASPSTPTQSKKQPELDHARNYVRKIKLRFESKPEIYKSFLRILHTFHEEHHTIKDVYDQVANLFRSHPDLLAEFKQFLPDKSAAIDSASPRGSKRRQTARTRRKTTNDYSPRHTPNANDYDFFESAKSQLRNEAFLFNDFIKILNLYNEDILTRVDLLIMTRDLFSEYPELYEEFRQFCDFNDIASLPEPRRRRHSPSPSPPRIDSRCEIDITTCKRYGPSYRGLPDEYIRPRCSGRNELCDEVLNDHWFSVPTGSEEGFKASLKNQYEENLFACEDKRHELDLVIELNSSAIQALIPLAKQLASCDEDDLVDFRIEDGLDILLLRSIERIYGVKGHSILQGISENPVVAIPIVLRRLQQKNIEWQAAKSSWNSIWQESQEKNYYRSLDHQSANFKLKEKKLLNPRELLAEIKNDYFEPNTVHTNTSTNNTPLQSSSEVPKVISLPTVLSFEMNESSIFADIEELIEFQAQRMYNSDTEPEKLKNFIESFIRKFFIAPPNDPSTEQPLGLFFGNNSFYVFFRFYQMLFERLREAKKMAKDSFENPTTVNATKAMMSSKLTTKPKRTFESVEAKYDYFLNKMLRPLVEGDIDSDKYEDLCRELFGISSYVLFTMDRLLQVLVKQILSIFLEDTSSKLFSLHSFEATRSNNGFVESIYHTNALDITGEERCFKFIYLVPEGKFTIQVLDSGTKPAIVELPKEKFHKPVDTDVQTEQPDSEVEHNVFLLRNRNKTSGSALLSQPVAAVNGLECKVCTNTYRLFYVEETEDYFYRTGQLSKVRNKRMTKQIERLHKWIDNRLSLS